MSCLLLRSLRNDCSRVRPYGTGRVLRVLGIETSCDDTAAAVVSSNGVVLAAAAHSQLAAHRVWGGVKPAVAQALHEQHLPAVVDECLRKAAVRVDELDAVAVTVRPGLSLCLVVGARLALSLCRRHRKPLLPVHHMRAHALVARLGRTDAVRFPFVCLLASGGHCILALVRGAERFVVLGRNVDAVAPGDALDKLARLLRLRDRSPRLAALCGGAAIERVAARCLAAEPRAHLAYSFDFCSRASQRHCSFALHGFSSKAHAFVAHLLREHGVDDAADLPWPPVGRLCASAQHHLLRRLARQVQRGVELLDAWRLVPSEPHRRVLVLSGGVAANGYIRQGLRRLLATLGYSLVVPPAELCTDNGVMIAWNGLEMMAVNSSDRMAADDLPEELWVDARWPIGRDWTAAVAKADWPLQANIKLDQLCDG